MPKKSAGLLPYRRRGNALEVLLVHPGGPFWAKKDEVTIQHLIEGCAWEAKIGKTVDDL